MRGAGPRSGRAWSAWTALRRALPLALLLTLPLAPAATAEPVPVHGTLRSTGPTTIHGANGFTLESPGVLLEARAGDEAFRLAFAEGRAVYVNLPVSRVRGAGGDFTEVALPEERLAEAGALRIDFAGDGPGQPTSVRILPTQALFTLDASAGRDLAVRHGPAVPPPGEDRAFAAAAQVDGHPTRPGAGAVLSGADLPGFAWEEPFAALVSGGTVQLDGGARWATGRWLNESRSAVAPDGSGVQVFDNRVVVVTGRDASLSWPEGAQGWAAVVTRLEGPLAGDISWTGVDATLEADGRDLPAEPALVHMRGTFRLDARFERQGAWDLAGEAEFLAVDAGPDWAGASVAAAAGIGLLALLLLLLPKGRLLALLLGTRVGRRLVKAKALGPPARRRVLEAIHVRQPVRAADLRHATGLSRTALAYHLEVLEGHHVIERRRGTGVRNATWMLNSGSLAFPIAASAMDAGDAGGEEVPETAQALAAANSHPLRRALFEAIGGAERPRSFAELRDVLPPEWQGLAQSTASHHLSLLVQAGAVEESRRGREKVYAARVRAEDARVEQYRRLLGHLGGLALVRRLAGGPVPLDRLAPRGGEGSATATLRRLGDLGLVGFDPAARTYELAPFLLPLAPSL